MFQAQQAARNQAPMTGITRRRVNDVRNVAEGQVELTSNTEWGQRGNDGNILEATIFEKGEKWVKLILIIYFLFDLLYSKYFNI